MQHGSPCIDTGDPASDYSNEPEPNGGRINIGAYGGTAEATTSDGTCQGDFDKDEDVDGSDLAVFAAGGTDVTLEQFAPEFGKTNCPQ